MKITKFKIILGSSSPRRRDILTQMGINFDVRVCDEEEKYPKNLKGKEVSEYLAIQKAKFLKGSIKKGELLITSDTIVCNDNIILTKPRDKTEAFKMLNGLSGKTHKVITSVCLCSIKKKVVFSDETSVRFSELDDDIISYYIEQHHPFDKAGSYGIQEWIGLIGIDRIKGSYTNVVGLPSSKLFQKIRNF